MKTYVSVECSRCRKEIKQDETVYCSECLANKDEIINAQDEMIKGLEEKIVRLENQILKLKGEI